MQFSYIIIDNSNNASAIKAKIDDFEQYRCVATCTSRNEAVNKTLELRPHLVFLSIDSATVSDDGVSFSIISEISEYLEVMPTFIVISDIVDFAYEAFQRGVTGFILRPIDMNVLRKCLYRYQKNKIPDAAKKICIKSQGDYHFVDADEIVYLKADNNTTDFYLENGKIISAFKTLKFFENILPTSFFRIHHSYVINIAYVNRITLGKSACYLLNNTIILPFSRTYKSNIDAVIARIS